MYKVFINDKVIELTDHKIQPEEGEQTFFWEYTDPAALDQHIRKFEEGNYLNCMIVYNDDLEELWHAFNQFYIFIEAGGGVVVDDEERMLFIYRKGKWDLPKGKLEKGENIADAALREVEEECGIANIEIVDKITTTYHTYTEKSKRILKGNYWYKMHSPHTDNLKPQLEEGITQVKWFSKDELEIPLSNTYPSIVEVINVLTGDGHDEDDQSFTYHEL